jgi:hypothetical protein
MDSLQIITKTDTVLTLTPVVSLGDANADQFVIFP